ncbi:MAG: hypothetical protein M3Y07_14275 [Acidobacteriota bacterium]|nr:hypothetical protein [Acidobacteriota bacterium]
MLELLIPVRAGVGGDLLPVDTQREIHLVEKARDGISRNRNIDLLKKVCDLLRRLACPLQSRDGIASRIVLQNDLDGIDYFGSFFHPLAPATHLAHPRLRLRP